MRSIYDQLSSALGQTARQGERAILWRGKAIQCVVLEGNTDTALAPGGLRRDVVNHVKVQRDLVPDAGRLEPHTNEAVVYPAVAVRLAGGGMLQPQNYIIAEIIADEFSFSLTLKDPSAA